ncbi:MAG TPA: hypothetical protein VFC24_09780 [Casimicrobiaceae bacterium]|nr:hypothetical protein [Casimicrobiaceae bacterium]
MNWPQRTWWIDGTVPDLQGALPDGVDIEVFAAWLGPELTNYRNAQNARASFGPVDEELKYVRRTRKALREVRALVGELHEPIRTGALLSEANVRHWDAMLGKGWHDMAARLKEDALLLHALLSEVERALKAKHSKRGRKRVIPRDELLASIVNWLRERSIDAESARASASEILSRACIDVPASERAIRRAAKRTGQK